MVCIVLFMFNFFFSNLFLFEGVFVERLKVKIIVKIYRVEGFLKSMCL